MYRGYKNERNSKELAFTGIIIKFLIVYPSFLLQDMQIEFSNVHLELLNFLGYIMICKTCRFKVSSD